MSCASTCCACVAASAQPLGVAVAVAVAVPNAGAAEADDAAAEAALLVESLTADGLDNVVPVRLVEAAETLARGLVSVIGYDKTAVCVLERESRPR